MMKKILQSCITALVMLVLGGIATATPVPSGSYFTAEEVSFWNVGDDDASESDFGMFSMITGERYEIFSYTDEVVPGASSRIRVSESNWAALSTGFGFYFDVHTGGASDATADYSWYSDSALNQYFGGASVDTNVEHIVTDLFLGNTGTSAIRVYLDADTQQDFDDMLVYGISCSIESVAPVPEPAAMLLSSTGLVGLIGFRRRKKQIKA